MQLLVRHFMFLGLRNHNFMWKSYVPVQSLSSTRTALTIFEQVYGSRRRRPTKNCLDAPWVPLFIIRVFTDKVSKIFIVKDLKQKLVSNTIQYGNMNNLML